jgi:hypothetical protein
MEMEHPTSCQSRRCRAAVGGTHKSDPVEATYGTSRVSAWLQQQPDDNAMLAVITAYRAIGAPTVFLSLPTVFALLAQTCELLKQAGDGGSA